MTPDERKKSLKWRTGGDQVVSLVARQVERYEVSLPGISVDDMNADLELATRLAPLAEAATEFAQALTDTILQARAECWWAATAYYTTLRRLADANPTLLAALEPAVEFFAHGPRQAKPSPEPSPSPSPSPAPVASTTNGTTGTTGSTGSNNSNG
nr:hypothetical protein [Kofleriaceae bacterium]